MINRFKFCLCVSSAFLLVGCTTSPGSHLAAGSDLTAPVTKAEAKSEACPAALLEAGASADDCHCIEDGLYTLGQVSGALSPNGDLPKAIFGDGSGKRKIAIGLLRHDAIEQCGLFDPDHTVAKNL